MAGNGGRILRADFQMICALNPQPGLDTLSAFRPVGRSVLPELALKK
jgi:hypothetical protein